MYVDMPLHGLGLGNRIFYTQLAAAFVYANLRLCKLAHGLKAWASLPRAYTRVCMHAHPCMRILTLSPGM